MTTSLLVSALHCTCYFFCKGCLMWVDSNQREKSGFIALRELLASYSVLHSVPMTWFWWKIKKWWVRRDKQPFLLLSFNVLSDGISELFLFPDNRLKAIMLYWFLPVKNITVKVTYGDEICQSLMFTFCISTEQNAWKPSAVQQHLQPQVLCSHFHCAVSKQKRPLSRENNKSSSEYLLSWI